MSRQWAGTALTAPPRHEEQAATEGSARAHLAELRRLLDENQRTNNALRQRLAEIERTPEFAATEPGVSGST